MFKLSFYSILTLKLAPPPVFLFSVIRPFVQLKVFLISPFHRSVPTYQKFCYFKIYLEPDHISLLTPLTLIQNIIVLTWTTSGAFLFSRSKPFKAHISGHSSIFQWLPFAHEMKFKVCIRVAWQVLHNLFSGSSPKHITPDTWYCLHHLENFKHVPFSGLVVWFPLLKHSSSYFCITCFFSSFYYLTNFNFFIETITFCCCC